MTPSSISAVYGFVLCLSLLFRSTSRMAVLSAVAVCYSVCALAAEGPPLKIGVFDQKSARGEGAGVAGLVRGLKRQGYGAATFADLHLVTLLEYDVVYLSDVHRPGRVHGGWRKTLKQFVQSGGSVLQTWHHHLFPEVGRGVLAHRGS